MATTVPMLAPDGTSGDIPQERVQDAIKAGFKQAVEMTSPDGKAGYIPVERQQDALSAGFKLAAPASSDTHNSVRGLFDASTAPASTEDRKGVPDWLNEVGDVSTGFINALGSVVAHPIQTVQGIGHAIAHPMDTAAAAGRAFDQHPGYTIGQALGGTVAGVGVGGAADAALSGVKPALGRVALMGRTPAEAYETALKPSTAISQADRESLVQTGLQNKIPVSKGGFETLSNRIDELNNAIKAEIAKDPTRPIDPNAVATRADQARANFAKQVNAQPDLDAIEASRQQFLKEQGAQPGKPAIAPQPTGILDAQGRPVMTQGTPATPPQPAPPMNAADAQEMKQGTYRVLKGKFGEQGSAAVEAQKSLARGIKEEIATQFPEIGNLNAQESKLLDLQPVLERAINRIGNHQLIGIGTPIAAAATQAVTGSGKIGAIAAVMKAVLDDPFVKSRLAISLSKGGNIPYGQAVTRVGAYSTALATTAAAAQASQGDQTGNR